MPEEDQKSVLEKIFVIEQAVVITIDGDWFYGEGLSYHPIGWVQTKKDAKKIVAGGEDLTNANCITIRLGETRPQFRYHELPKLNPEDFESLNEKETIYLEDKEEN